MTSAGSALWRCLRSVASPWARCSCRRSGEELGWRGYLQARWRLRLGALGTSLAVGATWALWHLPTAWGDWGSFPGFAVAVTAGGVVMGWLWETSRRSTLAAVALHTGINLGIVHASRGAM